MYLSANEIYHYDATGGKGDRYIVWQEEGESDSLFLDNQHDEIVIKVRWIFIRKLSLMI
ncbi:MAG: hypothetical protein ACLTTH_12330 [Holdemanella porci]